MLGDDGEPERILKIASDVTAGRRRSAELKAISAAIHRSQALIEFALDGTILDVNDNFLQTMGYRREQIIGQHHRMFCSAEDRQSVEYAEFWRVLGSGGYHAGVYKRISQDGRDVCPNDEAVISVTLHPSYLAKSYHPTRLLNGLGLRQVGSRERRIMPAKWTQKEAPSQPLVAPELFIAGNRKKLASLN